MLECLPARPPVINSIFPAKTNSSSIDLSPTTSSLAPLTVYLLQFYSPFSSFSRDSDVAYGFIESVDIIQIIPNVMIVIKGSTTSTYLLRDWAFSATQMLFFNMLSQIVALQLTMKPIFGGQIYVPQAERTVAGTDHGVAV